MKGGFPLSFGLMNEQKAFELALMVMSRFSSDGRKSGLFGSLGTNRCELFILYPVEDSEEASKITMNKSNKAIYWMRIQRVFT
jgi:hypothetical protein